MSQPGLEEQKAPTVYVDARRKYSVAEVVDAVRSGDTAAIVDAARLYPALVVSLQTDPMLLFRSLYGHKKARRAEMLLRDVYYLDRKTLVEKFLHDRDVPTLPPAGMVLIDETDEARALLERLKSDGGDND